jgi:hypothetical protein
MLLLAANLPRNLYSNPITGLEVLGNIFWLYICEMRDVID